MKKGYLGIDVGTSSSKAVLVDEVGAIVRSATRQHRISSPSPGMAEMDPAIWWDEVVSLSRELTAPGDLAVTAVGVSGMGPNLVVTDDLARPLRPAILYGIDSRATREIQELTAELGGAEIVERCGSALSTQAVGPKLMWLRRNEPEIFRSSRRMYMTASWLVEQLTGSYVLDHHSASQATPLYDIVGLRWHREWADRVAPGIELPELHWSGDVVGTVTPEAALLTGLTAGTPVIAGTIDAWAEAVSVDAQSPGDLMLMYGTTMFLIATVPTIVTAPGLWTTVGALPDTRNLAAGLAASGSITDWLRTLTGGSYAELTSEAAASPPGSNGLLMLPYFAGERTPISDPQARGVLAGLTTHHNRGDLYRCALEGTAFAVRHNIETIRDAGADIRRVVGVGGGMQGGLWASIVSDVTGVAQERRAYSVGASYGVAYLAAKTDMVAHIAQWNPVAEVVVPNQRRSDTYNELYPLYRELYPATSAITHQLAQH